MYPTSLRTNTCGELNQKSIKKEARLAGFVSSSRDHGGLIFIDLRDHYGITQIVFDPKNKSIFKKAESLRREDVIQIIGKVRARPKNMENPKLKTGKIEVLVQKINILAKAKTPPIEIDDRIIASEDIRLKYRYLDLRRPIMQNNFTFRHKIAQLAREYFFSQGFLEIETPLLVRATPEGARDYLVPSRVNPGKFYALPQSPQLYKQLLMISGFDRYFQLARCLRDEDLRADRQPEHTQLDFEMAFVDEKDIMSFVEGLYKYILKKALNINIKENFPVLSYQEAIDKYGTDKPDLRFKLELIDITDIAKKSNFKVFKKAESIKAINPEKDFTRKEIEALTDFASSVGAKGLAWIKYTGKLESPITKFFPSNLQKELIKKINPKKNSTIFFIADNKKNTDDILANIRNKLGKDLNLINKNEFKFCWITNFPLFEFNEDEQTWQPMHHIFSSPKPECIKYLEKDPSKVLGNLLDIVLNGVELGSGSIRINTFELQERVMKVIGLKKEEAKRKFGFLLDAYSLAAPGPHGGMGLGFDRLVATLLGYDDIREVIAFPKNKAAQCPMDSSPSEISQTQLKDLHIKLNVVKRK